MNVIPRLDKKTRLKVLCGGGCSHQIASLPEGNARKGSLILDPGHKEVPGERYPRWILTNFARERWEDDRERAAHQDDAAARKRLVDGTSTRHRRPVVHEATSGMYSTPEELGQNYDVLTPPIEILCRYCGAVNVVEAQWFDTPSPFQAGRESES